MPDHPVAPRGRHAPPLAVRLDRQRGRLFHAAAAVFARQGYADASAEAVAREAGMSKATFYEHFANKEECILALLDAAAEVLLEGLEAARPGPGADTRVRAGMRTFLKTLAAHPAEARTLLVEVVGAGPRALERRDRVLADFAGLLDERNRQDAEAGDAARFATGHDAFAVVGAVVELASRQLRVGDPENLRALEPVVDRLVCGLLETAPAPAT
jgi:AcrR family transcriptional regulator